MRSSPRILMLSDVYFPRVNGVSTSIQTFRRDLAALGCPSVLLAPEYPQARKDEPDVVRVRSRYLPFDPEDRMLVARDFERAALALDGDFDLIHILTPFVAHSVGLRLARHLKIPTVETYHTFFEEYFHHYLPFVPRALLRAVARRISRRQCNAVDAIIAPSPQMADALRAYGVETDIQVIPTGLDMRRFAGGDGDRFRRQLGIDGGRPVALTVGRVAHEKNIGFLIAAIERVRRIIPEILFVIAGEGPALPALQRRVTETGLADNVRFVGNLDRDGALLDCYKCADVFIFASRTETQGLVLLEAMALGVPVVSTAVMGTKTVLEGATGAIVVEEDEAQFANTVIRILRDRQLRFSLAARSSDFVERHWSSAEMAQRVHGLYQGLAGRSAGEIRRRRSERRSSLRSVTTASIEALKMKSLGKRSEGARLERIIASPRWTGDRFQNQHPITPGLRDPTTPMPTIGEFLCGGERRVPQGPLPSTSPLDAWRKPPASGLRATWLGHSTVLIEIDGLRILTDPVWGSRASPTQIAGPKRFQPIPVALRAMPPIDLAIVSHDHYDHLDYPTIRELARRDVPFVTSLGVGAHLEAWGVRPERIVELDWWESHRVPNSQVTVTAAPSQHFSGRGFKDRNASLWSSMVIRSERQSVFFSGDTGLTPEYQSIREKLGPFDLVMLEVGAFHPAWGDIHLGPENALKALALLGGGAFLPVHWGTFCLAMHAWDQPAEVLLHSAPKAGARLLMPRLGEPVEPSHEKRIDPWWHAVDTIPVRAPAAPLEITLAKQVPWPID